MEDKLIEFIINHTSFQYYGTEKELATWRKNKYKAWYEMPWQQTEEEQNAKLSVRLFTKLSLFFHKHICATRDVEFLREKAKITYNWRDIQTEILTGELAIYSWQLTEKWLEQQFAYLNEEFAKEISQYPKSVVEYYNERKLDFSKTENIFFHLAETKNNATYPFAFMASYSEVENGQVKHHPLSYAVQKYRNEPKKIVEIIGVIKKLEHESSLIRKLLASKELFQTIYFTSKEAQQFLNELPLYAQVGVRTKVPNWWQKRKTNYSVQLKVQEDSQLGAKTLLKFVPEINYGDINVSKAELEAFLQESEGLRLFKGQWVEVNHAKIADLLSEVDDLAAEVDDGLSVLDAFKLGLKKQQSIDIEGVLKFFQTAVSKLQEQKIAKLPSSLNATLLPYQEIGRKWLLAMDHLNMGVVLADDMGLGKTLQVISYLETLRAKREQGQDRGTTANTTLATNMEEADKRVLIVLPTTLIANWEEELKKFAPQANFTTYHGKNKNIGNFITLTSYGMLKREKALLETKWDVVILDEAQAIKSNSTQQSKAAKLLQARMKIALTGTPIENDLMDLFSIFDFILPSYLGKANEFKNYSKKLMESGSGYEQLKHIVQPFIMRRLKSDKTIIKDLPQKLERKEYIDLTNKQLVLYRKVLDKLAKQLTINTDKMDRRSTILATLTSLKQINNHPSQYRGSDEYNLADSGKFVRLVELVKEIYAARERVLIFTQYKEIIPHLAKILCDSLGDDIEPLLLHGDTPLKERQRLVTEFNSDKYYPFMILSLKAAGVGLNLTAANHVIHFDRWWNPQVERQATDRAYRIGQRQDVLVHYFICRQTIDVSIDELLEKKRNLSENVIAENKTPAITEMNDQELREFFAFRKD